MFIQSIHRDSRYQLFYREHVVTLRNLNPQRFKTMHSAIALQYL